jgi:hypothetical protein
VLKSSTYYMNNRKAFKTKINSLLYKGELEAEKAAPSFANRRAGILLTHQKIVRDYLNIDTPYRGLLLYHGLGSKNVHLHRHRRRNEVREARVREPRVSATTFRELKKCGDLLQKKNQFWG